MSQTPTEPSNPRPLTILLAEAGIGRSSLIRIVGVHGMPALLWFCRHGFEQVGYLRAGQAGPYEEADLVFVAQTCNRLDLYRLLEGGPQARDGGALIFRLARHSAEPQIDLGVATRLLARYGYAVERSLQGAHRSLFVARRQAQPSVRAA